MVWPLSYDGGRLSHLAPFSLRHTSRLLVSAAVSAFIAFSSTLSAFDRPGHAELPDIDKRVPPAEVPAERVAAGQRLKARVPASHVEFDNVLKTPKSIVSRDGFLSGPRGQGKGIAAQTAASVQETDGLHPLRGFLKEHRELFGHADQKLSEARVKRHHVSRHNGLRSYVFQQEFNGLEVVDAVLTAHITRDDELVSVSGGFVEDLQAAADAGTPRRNQFQGEPPVTAAQGIVYAAEGVGENIALEEVRPIAAEAAEKPGRRKFKAGPLPGEADAKLVWLPLNSSALRLCWEVEVTRRLGGERYRLWVDAETGEVLIRRMLTKYADNASYRVYTSDSPSPFSPGHQIPLTNQPPLVERTLVTVGAISTNASPTGWIHPGDNETRGNNVHAHLDRNGDDFPDLPRPQGSPFRMFDFPIDFTQPPSAYGDAAVVQLFYWCNWMHDKLYELGFTETAGNYQKDNFGRGGAGNDFMLADAQDGSGTDNANFTPAPDGTPGRIQMFVFTGPTPDRDGDFDAEIIIHEYVHGLSDRLVGGGVGISALQSAGMGEGWSDFYALAMLAESGEDPHAAYAMGGYATDGFNGLQENYYFGIRRYPYSTDMTKNPLTFKDIDPTQAIPHSEVPLNPIDVFNPFFASEVHNQGEVWCVTLWEMRANLVDKYGFAKGNQLALQLVTDGMKLSPRNPNFLEARDAIILADQVNNGGANFNDLWRAFAKRGMGFSARSPDSVTTIGVSEAHDLPDALLIVPAQAFISAGALGGAIAPQCKTYTLTNHTEEAVEWSATPSENWITATPSTGILEPRSAVTVTVCLATNGNHLAIGDHAGYVAFANLTSGLRQERAVSIRIMAFGNAPFFDDFESGPLRPEWLVTGTGFFRSQVTDQNGPRGRRHLTMDNTGNGISSRNEVTLGLDLAGYSNVVLRFWAKQYGEEPDGPPPTPFQGGADFDGVAISTDGIDWYEVQGFRSLGSGYSEFRLNLDEALARFGLEYNQTFRIRFNEFDNFSIPLDGIAIDEVSVTGVPYRRLAMSVPAETAEGDGTLTGFVSIAVPRPDDLQVRLTSSDTSKLQLPQFIVIPAGGTQAAFNLTIVDNALIDGTQTAFASATAADYFSESDSVIIHDNENNALRLRLWPVSAREGDGLYPKMGIVRVEAPPARDLQVYLTSEDEEEAQVAPSVIIRAGQTSAAFDVLIVDDTRLDGTRAATIRAHVENWQGDTATIEVADNDSPTLQLTLPNRVSEGDRILTNAGVVKLLATLETNLTVTLTGSDDSELEVSPFVIIPAGRSSAPFDLVVIDDDADDGTETVAVSAWAPNHAPASASLDVLDDETPPRPYQPQPADRSSGQSLSTDLAWLGGVGEVIRNGGFETGDFTGWYLEIGGLGGFVINDGKLDPQSFDAPSEPYEGKYSVITDQTGGGHHVLYQDVLIPAEAKGATLLWWDKIRNHSTQYDFNQYFAVEIRNVSNEKLETLFTTAPGFPLTNDWTARTFDLTAYRGQTIRIAFVEDDHLGYFNVHLDNVSLVLADNGVTTFDVYFGTNSYLTATNLLGNTATNFWDLPELELNASYYWQIVSRRGTTSKAGPVWQFSTRGVGAVHHFDFSPIVATQVIGKPFPATIFAKDDINNIETNFQGTVHLSAFQGSSNSSAVVITEIDTGTNDRIEFMNVSGRRINMANWQISVYDSRSWPAPKSVVTLPTNAVAPVNGLFVLSAFGVAPGRYPAFFTGTNITWNFSAISNYIAVLLLDASGRVVDFVCAGNANSTQITNPVSISQIEWSGLAVPPPSNAIVSIQRTGSLDNGRASDWVIATNTTGRRFASLQLPFASRFPVAIAPLAVSNFVNGVWSGELTIEQPSEEVTIIADDKRSHIGVTGPFSVSAVNDIAVTVVDTPDVAILGDELTYRIMITNTGPFQTRGVVFSNQLPVEVEFLSVATSQGISTRADRVVSCDLGSLAPNASAMITIRVRAMQAGIVTNVVFAGPANGDAFVPNNSAIAVSTLTAPTLATGAATVNEGFEGTTMLVFNLRLSAPSRLPVSVAYQTADVSATAGEDYVASSGTITFAPGTVVQSISVPIITDRLNEGLEQFDMRLSSPVNCEIATPQVRGRINDDDLAPLVSISDVTVLEPGPGEIINAAFQVQLSAPSGLDIFVNYSTTNGSAVAGRDFFTEVGQLGFPRGVTNQTITVRVTGDTTFESNETFHITLFNPLNTFLADAQGVGTIEDNGFVALDHFEWAPISSPQHAGTPFTATITARDGRNLLFTNFNDTVQITAVSESRTATIGGGSNTWEFPMSTFYHDARAQVIYLAEEIGGPGKVNSLALNVKTVPGQTMSNWTIRLKHTARDSYASAAWETNDWVTVYRQDEIIHDPGWTTFLFDQPFEYDGTNNVMVDLSFDNRSFSTDGLVAADSTDSLRSITFRTDGAFGNPMAWSGNTPPGSLSRSVPQASFTVENFVAVDPIQTAAFVDGVWTGLVRVLEPGKVSLRARDETGRNGTTVRFLVDAANNPVPTVRAGLSGTRVRISFVTAAGHTYRVEATDSLVQPQWRTVAENVIGTGSLVEITDPRAAIVPQSFYRIRVLP